MKTEENLKKSKDLQQSQNEKLKTELQSNKLGMHLLPDEVLNAGVQNACGGIYQETRARDLIKFVAGLKDDESMKERMKAKGFTPIQWNRIVGRLVNYSKAWYSLAIRAHKLEISIFPELSEIESLLQIEKEDALWLPNSFSVFSDYYLAIEMEVCIDAARIFARFEQKFGKEAPVFLFIKQLFPCKYQALPKRKENIVAIFEMIVDQVPHDQPMQIRLLEIVCPNRFELSGKKQALSWNFFESKWEKNRATSVFHEATHGHAWVFVPPTTPITTNSPFENKKKMQTKVDRRIAYHLKKWQVLLLDNKRRRIYATNVEDPLAQTKPKLCRLEWDEEGQMHIKESMELDCALAPARVFDNQPEADRELDTKRVNRIVKVSALDQNHLLVATGYSLSSVRYMFVLNSDLDILFGYRAKPSFNAGAATENRADSLNYWHCTMKTVCGREAWASPPGTVVIALGREMLIGQLHYNHQEKDQTCTTSFHILSCWTFEQELYDAVLLKDSLVICTIGLHTSEVVQYSYSGTVIACYPLVAAWSYGFAYSVFLDPHSLIISDKSHQVLSLRI
jgi:hypothetical protein